MASATADLQRDLGGAVMQSILGALLTAGYASAATKAIAESPQQARITESVENSLTKSFSSASDLADRYPNHAAQIVNAAQASFLHGEDWAYTAGIVAVLIGAAIVFFLFPKVREERALLERYAEEDSGGGTPEPAVPA